MELFKKVLKGVQKSIYDVRISEQVNDDSQIYDIHPYEKMSIQEITMLLITNEVVKINIEIKSKD